MSNVPAGWHLDPAGSGRQRWWDGNQWTDHYADAPPAYAQTQPQQQPRDPSTIWEAVGKPVTGIGGGRYRLTATHLFFEKGTVSLKAQQFPIQDLYDVDAAQTMTQKARGVGTITLHVHRSGGVEVVRIEDVPNFREGVQAINDAAAAARDALHRKANTSTVQYAGVPPVAAQPVAQQPAAAAPADDPIALLERLGKLRDAGVVTPEEFEAKKAELLSRL